MKAGLGAVAARRLIFLGGFMAPTATPFQAQSARVEFTQRYCSECHVGAEAEADFRVDLEPYDLTREGSAKSWSLALDYVESGRMPPAEALLQPPGDEVERFLAEVRRDLEAAGVAESPVGPRRMNRSEHAYTLFDLFGNLNLRIPEALEAEPGFSFDTFSEGLHASTEYLDACLQLATGVADRVVRLPHAERVQVVTKPAEWERSGCWYGLDRNEVCFSGVNKTGRGGAVWDRAFVAPEPGIYSVRLRVSADGPSGHDGRPLRLGFYAVDPTEFRHADRVQRSQMVRIGELEVTNLHPQSLDVEIPLERGESFQVYCENRLAEQYPDRGLTRVELWEFIAAARTSPAPTVRLRRMEVTGPVRLLSRQVRILGEREPAATEEFARSVLLPLAERAYRRPLADAEEQALVSAVRAHMPDAAPALGVHYGIRRILCSPQFLYLNAERDPDDEYGLASRLSYFLWSSLPDADLLEHARQGRLRDPEVLRAQVLRMIADPKASRFVESFAGQWLGNRDAATQMVCDRRYVWSELLRHGILRSTERFFDEVLRRNLSIRTFIDSDFTYASEPMRIAWGFPGEHPAWDVLEDRQLQSSIWPEPERLDLTSIGPEVPREVAERGGVLGLSSVLMATGDGVESSPVLRGVWVLENLFGTPPLPPPDDIPALAPSASRTTSVRAVLAAHQAAASCARCHAEIDPLGLALEHYDAIGNWRTEYSLRTFDDEGRESLTHLPLDTVGTLPDGSRLEGPADIKTFLLHRPEMFTRCLATKLFEYANGRELSAADRRAVEKIVQAEPRAGYGLQDLIVAAVRSAVFVGR